MSTESVCLYGLNHISFAVEPILKVGLPPLHQFPPSFPSPRPDSTETYRVFQFRCYCVHERRLTGNGFSNNLLMSTVDLQVLSGTLRTNARTADSGNTITTHFCGDCGSLLYRTSDGYPGTMVVKAGCIDDDGVANAGFVPEVEIFTRSRVPWMKPVEGAKQEIANFTAL